MLEETGYRVSIDVFIGNARRYFQSTTNEPLINDGYFYLAKLLEKKQEPTEIDHYMKWIAINNTEEFLFHEHHYWAIQESLKR